MKQRQLTSLGFWWRNDRFVGDSRWKEDGVVVLSTVQNVDNNHSFRLDPVKDQIITMATPPHTGRAEHASGQGCSSRKRLRHIEAAIRFSQSAENLVASEARGQ